MTIKNKEVCKIAKNIFKNALCILPKWISPFSFLFFIYDAELCSVVMGSLQVQSSCSWILRKLPSLVGDMSGIGISFY
jgi:hypothetical protein